MIAGSGGNQQEVIISLRLQADSQNGAVSRLLEEQVRGASDRATQVFEANGHKQAAASQSSADQIAHVWKRLADALEGLDATLQQKRASSANRGADAQIQAAQRVQHQEATRERQLLRQEAAQEHLIHHAIEGYAKMGESVGHIVKGIALMSGATEEDIKKLSEKFEKWKAIADVVGGSIHLYLQISDQLLTMKQYTLALTRQQELLNAARLAGAAIDAGGAAASAGAKGAGGAAAVEAAAGAAKLGFLTRVLTAIKSVFTVHPTSSYVAS
jgi:hypothetical protein